jgi:hypothetical protein
MDLILLYLFEIILNKKQNHKIYLKIWKIFK